MIDNSAFPDDWFSAGIAGKCAVNCTHCGKCAEVLGKVLKPDPNHAFSAKDDLSVNSVKFSAGDYTFG